MPLWQWLLAIPVVAALGTAIVLFVYISFFHPKAAQGIRVTRTIVLDRVEKARPDGSIDLAGSYVLVRIEGRDLRLTAHQPDWSMVAKGDPVEVEFAGAANGSLQVASWKRATDAGGNP